MRKIGILVLVALLVFTVLAVSTATAVPVTIKVEKSGKPIDVVIEIYNGNGIRVFRGETSNGTASADLEPGKYRIYVFEWNDKLGGYIQYKFEKEVPENESSVTWELELEWKKIDWRPIAVVAGLGIAGFFLILVMVGAARAALRR